MRDVWPKNRSSDSAFWVLSYLPSWRNTLQILHLCATFLNSGLLPTFHVFSEDSSYCEKLFENQLPLGSVKLFPTQTSTSKGFPSGFFDVLSSSSQKVSCLKFQILSPFFSANIQLIQECPYECLILLFRFFFCCFLLNNREN